MLTKEKYTISEIKNLMTQLNLIFDVVRLVDPITNLVLSYDEHGNKHLDERKCYEIWGKTKACENCLSMSASYCAQPRRTKYEFIDKDIFYVVSFPINLEDYFESCSLVLEIVSNVTDEILFEAIGKNEIVDKITERNKLFYEDSLTGVKNRRFLDDGVFCKAEYNMEGRSCVFIMLDMFDFKFINDNYGHEKGDEVLRDAGKVLRNAVRGNDVIIRYGGDEFLILLSGCDTRAATMKVEQLRADLAGIVYDEAKDLRLQCNFGFSFCESFVDNKDAINILIAEADRLMYEEKKLAHSIADRK